MNKFLTKNNSGFTLVELLLYISVSSVILLATTLFLFNLFEARIKNQVISEVEQQGLQVMEIINQTIRNGAAINSPLPGSSSSVLSIDTYSSPSNPTVFDLASGAIRIKEGSGSVVLLTNSSIEVRSLLFQNSSRADTPGLISVSFDIVSSSTNGRYEYNFNKTFQDSASQRHP